MSSRVSHRISRVALAAGLLLVAPACQSDGEDDPGGSATSAPTSTSESPTPTPTPTPTATVEPADGVLIDVPGATMHALKGYRSIADYGLVQGWGNDEGSVILAPDLTQATSLDQWARQYARDQIGTKYAERKDDYAVAGKYNAWQLVDTEDPIVDHRVFGVMYLDGAWTIDFAFYEDIKDPLTQEERQEIIDSMLITFAPHAENP